MKNINISKKKFEGLKKIELPKEVISTEANFYKMNYLGKVKVFKSLHKTSGPIFANKLFTLEMLNEYREILPSNFVLPESLISVDKEIKGFSLPLIKGINLESFLADKNIKSKTKLLYIKKIGEILEQLDHIRNNSNLDSIYLNDLHASNFIVDSKNQDIKVVDLDSCRICDSKPFIARYLTPLSLLNRAPGQNKYDIYQKELIKEQNSSEIGFSVLQMMSYEEYESYYCKYANYRDQLGFVNSNQESDLYCYVILFLNYLYGENVGSFNLEQFYDYIYYLEKIGFNEELIKSIIKIVTSAPNDNIGQYLNTITEEQVARANKKVYKMTRNLV